MTARPSRRLMTALAAVVVLLSLSAAVGGAASARPSASPPSARISGNGSTWAGNAIADWVAAVKAQGVTVDFTPDGSSSGRKNFAQGLADYSVSEIPYSGDTSDPQDSNRPNFGYGLVPVVAGGTSYMYNLPVGGKRLTTLKLSQAALAKIFSGQVTRWNDPIIASTNPGVALPAQRITVVVRSDGSGATAQFTLWMLRQFPNDYKKLCSSTGSCNGKNATSYYPYQGLSNFTAQSGSNGVTTYTANTPYTINFDEYSYALGVGFPVAQIQNAAGFFTIPTDNAVAVALTQAKINNDKTSQNYLSQDLSKVYAYKDPRTYPISAYSYLIVPTQTHGNFTASKGATLSYFNTFALCEGQRTMGALGYSPLPMNLVLAAMDQVLKIPGVYSGSKTTIAATKNGVKTGKTNPCNNPTFQPGDSPSHNILTDKAPFPAGCDAKCQAPWAHTGTSGGSTTNSGGGSTNAGGGATNGGGGATGGTTDANGDGVPDAPGSVTGGGGTSGTACDPSTTDCSSVVSGGDLQAASQPTVLDNQGGWGTAQFAIFLSVFFVILLVLGPPIAAKILEARRPVAAAGVVGAQPPASYGGSGYVPNQPSNGGYTPPPAGPSAGN